MNNLEIQKEIFISNLVRFRKRLGMTQKDMARVSGLTQQAISNFERGNRDFTLSNLIKYLNALGIDINDIIY